MGDEDFALISALMACQSVYNLVPYSPHIDNSDVLIISQLMAQLGDEDVEAAGIEEAVIAPKLQEDFLALHHVVPILHEHAENLGLTMGQFHFLVIVLQGLLDSIQTITANHQTRIRIIFFAFMIRDHRIPHS